MVRSVAGNLPEQVKNNQSVNMAAGNGGQKMSQYSWFTVYGAVPSHTIYFEEGAYTQAYDTELAGAGYTTVIHHGEEGLPLVTSDVETAVWHPGAVGRQGEEPRYRLGDAVGEKGNIIFTVSYTREDEMYDSNPFITMLDYLKEYGSRSVVSVMAPWKA